MFFFVTDRMVEKLARRLALQFEQEAPNSMITDEDEPRLLQATVDLYKPRALAILEFINTLDD